MERTLSAPDSHLHLDPDALNALLAEFVDRPGKLSARFEKGTLVLATPDLVLRITALEVRADGVEIRLQVAPAGDG